jgi:Cu/Ag efflux pump CusA
MFISDFAIKRPIITIVTMLALVVFGLVSLLKLDTDEFPDFEQPIVFVGVGYPARRRPSSSARWLGGWRTSSRPSAVSRS